MAATIVSAAMMVGTLVLPRRAVGYRRGTDHAQANRIAHAPGWIDPGGAMLCRLLQQRK